MSTNNLREQLITAGLWDVNDVRDPSLVPAACDDLELRCHEEFPHSKGWAVSYVGVKTDFLPYRLYLQGEAEIFAREATRARVICQAALRLARQRGKETARALAVGGKATPTQPTATELNESVYGYGQKKPLEQIHVSPQTEG